MGWIGFGVLGLAALAAVLYAVGIYNGLVALRHAVDRAWANVDVLLKQRHDELPKLVDAVRGYLRHERECLERLTAARARLAGARRVEDKGRADGELRQALERLFAVAEAYPDLKADGSFQMLQGRISELEEQIADRREFFNHSVNALNVRIEQLPDVFLARWLALEARGLFQARPAEREDVRIDLA
jgi:LemA protein